MGYQPLEELLPQSRGSRYKLVIMAARRAVELAEGAPKLILDVDNDRPATLALEEIRHKKVELKPEPGQEPEKKKAKDKK